jgi:hypothetical protein
MHHECSSPPPQRPPSLSRSVINCILSIFPLSFSLPPILALSPSIHVSLFLSLYVYSATTHALSERVHTCQLSPPAASTHPSPAGIQPSVPNVTASRLPTCAAYSRSVAATISSLLRACTPPALRASDKGQVNTDRTHENEFDQSNLLDSTFVSSSGNSIPGHEAVANSLLPYEQKVRARGFIFSVALLAAFRHIAEPIRVTHEAEDVLNEVACPCLQQAVEVTLHVPAPFEEVVGRELASWVDW